MRSELPPIDPTQPSRVPAYVRPTERAFINSLAFGNQRTVTDVIHELARLGMALTRLGVEQELVVAPPKEGEPETRIMLGVDFSVAVTSIAEYEALRTGNTQGSPET